MREKRKSMDGWIMEAENIENLKKIPQRKNVDERAKEKKKNPKNRGNPIQDNIIQRSTLK